MKSQHYSLSRQNSVKFGKDFNQDRICITPTLLAHWYIFASLGVRCQVSGVTFFLSFGRASWWSICYQAVLPRLVFGGRNQNDNICCWAAALYCTDLHCTALHCTALKLHGTALHCTALQFNALHLPALNWTTLHCTALHCTALHIYYLFYIIFKTLLFFSSFLSIN